MSDALDSLSTLEVYERWAPTYPPRPHNPLMRAEQQVLLAKLPAVARRRVLDLACGSGRYAKLLWARGARDVVAADFSRAMLDRVTAGFQDIDTDLRRQVLRGDHHAVGADHGRRRERAARGERDAGNGAPERH